MRRRLNLSMIPLAAALSWVSAAPSFAAQADGLTINLPVVGRVTGSNNTLFVTSIDVSNNTPFPAQVDFFFDGVDVVTQEAVVIDGSVTNSGVVAQGVRALRGYSNVHFDDFVASLVQAGMLTAEARNHGVLGSVMFVFDGFSRSGQAAASARFFNNFGGGTVGVGLAGREITENEPRSLVATVRDTRGKPGPQLYTNMFINNTGLTPSGEAGGTITVEVTARANSSGELAGTPLLIERIPPGHTRSVNLVLNALKVPANSEDTILVFARVTSGDAAIAGVVSTVDATTSDGSVIPMARGD